MAENYSRPSSGFTFKFKGQNTNTVPDKLPEEKYVVAQNVRAYGDTSMRNRPGLTEVANAGTGNPVLAVRAYATLGTDNDPRFLFKSNTSGTAAGMFLDTGAEVDSGYAPGVGASLIPYRPNQSPQSYMYAGDANQYRKLSAPDTTNTVTAQKVGIAEPQTPVDAGMSGQNFSYVGAPVPASYTPTGVISAITTGNRVTDTVQGVFPDPTGCGVTTLQVGANTSTLTPAIYKTGSVTAYFFNTGASGGTFVPSYPLDPTSAVQVASGNSLMFNYGTFINPSYMPMAWAVLEGNTITGITTPWSGATTNYIMAVLATLYVPQAGNYTLNIGHDDGMFFAVQGAYLVSGPINDPVGHTKTAVAGYSFTGSTLPFYGGIAGYNHHGTYSDTYVLSFPASGFYPIEIDYCQNTVFQTLVALSNGSFIVDTGSSPGYQRYMAISVDSQSLPLTVQDVFPPLPSAIAIQSIYYYSGTTGRCVITPASLSPVAGASGTSLYEQNLLSGVRRGALVQIGNEVCLVLNVTTGPSGNVCFEVVTQNAHTTADNLFGVSAISVFGTANLGDGITSPDIIFNTTGAGVGAVTSLVTTNPFVSNNFSFQPNDYIHFSINVDTLANLNEVKILFDVGDGTFTQNFYFYSVRPNDIVNAINNQLTQLGAAQLVTQRSTIDEEQSVETGNQGFTTSSAQSTTGDSQWSEILFPISALTRVGNDQSKSLQNVNASQLLVNCSAGVNMQFNSLSVLGGYAPDAGDTGAPFQYIIRGRSSITGALSNPSPAMRYGVTSRRGLITVYIPTTYSDSQVDTWDIFRFGGALTAYTFIGSVPLGSSNQFLDTYEDSEIVSNEQIDYENFEPWPTVDLPLTATATNVCGTIAVVSVAASILSNVLRYLPGNLVQIQQQVYTLWTRPILIAGIDTPQLLFQFVENAGFGTGLAANIYEPAMANQILPYLWGPTEEGGNIFGAGDSLRPGYVSFTKNFQPDSAPDRYNIELCPPSEPILGGEVLNGNSYAASTIRWWQLRPSFGSANQYTPVEAPVGRGLAAPFAICTDGKEIYFVAKDGICSHAGGPRRSLTDADLYNLFPHDGIPGRNVTYNGVTTYAPDYGRAATFRMAYSNSYLYFNYQDTTGTPRTLVCDLRHEGWSTDVYLGGVGAAIHYGVEQQEGSLEPTDSNYAVLIVGGADGKLYSQTPDTIDGTSPIQCILATREFTAEDERAQKLFGDLFFDFLNPAAASSTNLTLQAMSLGSPVTTTVLTQSNARQQLPTDLNGGLYAFSLGMFLTWTIPVAMPPVVLYTWEPSYISKPAATADRYQDWDDAGVDGAKWVQGFLLESLTSVPKLIGIRNGDNQVLQQTFTVNQPTQSEVAYSFETPFIAHMMRWESQDGVDWTFFNIKWIFQPTPEQVTTWWCQASSCGWEGYGHVYSANCSYASQAPVNFLMTFDGTTQTYQLPSTGGVMTKVFLNLQANKGKLYTFQFQSTAGFSDLRIDKEAFVIQVGGWGRQTAYRAWISVGGEQGTVATI